MSNEKLYGLSASIKTSSSISHEIRSATGRNSSLQERSQRTTSQWWAGMIKELQRRAVEVACWLLFEACKYNWNPWEIPTDVFRVDQERWCRGTFVFTSAGISYDGYRSMPHGSVDWIVFKILRHLHGCKIMEMLFWIVYACFRFLELVVKNSHDAYLSQLGWLYLARFYASAMSHSLNSCKIATYLMIECV